LEEKTDVEHQESSNLVSQLEEPAETGPGKLKNLGTCPISRKPPSFISYPYDTET